MTMATVTTHSETAPRIRVIFAALMLVVLLAALDGTIVSTSLPTIVTDLGGLEHISWVVTAYLLAQTVVTPLYGKLGDLYGRKVMLLIALVVFLAGSALCGLAQGMTSLIVFRFLQGLGGGGLIVGAQAVIGDVVSPRERGRYQGLFGAVFGVATVIGPLLGGGLTSSLSWRWIFYVNLPFGLLALFVIATVLPSAGERVSHPIDWPGAAALATALSAVVLLVSLGGNSVEWGSPLIPVLGVLAVLAAVAFVGLERRAAEPILPLRLFAIRSVAVATGLGMVVGFALFGSITYLPLFLQRVHGSTPTESGLQLVPMMGGLLVTSIASGRIITRTGRYRVFPIAGTAILTIGLLLLQRLQPETGVLERSLYLLVIGLGLGMVMQVLVLAVQNAVEYRDLGVATSSATLARFIGGSVGVAILGAIFTARLESESNAAIGVDAAYTTAIHEVFLIAAGGAAVAFALAWLLEEVPLRRSVGTAGPQEAFAAPRQTESLIEITRQIGVLVGRDRRRENAEDLARRAGLTLSAASTFVLWRLSAEPGASAERIVDGWDVEVAVVEDGVAALTQDGLVDDSRNVTAAGGEVLIRLREARRARLAEHLEGWSPDRDPELTELVHRLSRELDVPVPA